MSTHYSNLRSANIAEMNEDEILRLPLASFEPLLSSPEEKQLPQQPTLLFEALRHPYVLADSGQSLIVNDIKFQDLRVSARVQFDVNGAAGFRSCYNTSCDAQIPQEHGDNQWRIDNQNELISEEHCGPPEPCSRLQNVQTPAPLPQQMFPTSQHPTANWQYPPELNTHRSTDVHSTLAGDSRNYLTHVIVVADKNVVEPTRQSHLQQAVNPQTTEHPDCSSANPSLHSKDHAFASSTPVDDDRLLAEVIEDVLDLEETYKTDPTLTDHIIQQLRQAGAMQDVYQTSNNGSHILNAVSGPSNNEYSPTNVIPCPSNNGPTSTNVISCPSNKGYSSTNVIPCPSNNRSISTNVDSYPSNNGYSSTNVIPCPSNNGPTSTNVISCPSNNGCSTLNVVLRTSKKCLRIFNSVPGPSMGKQPRLSLLDQYMSVRKTFSEQMQTIDEVILTKSGKERNQGLGEFHQSCDDRTMAKSLKTITSYSNEASHLLKSFRRSDITKAELFEQARTLKNKLSSHESRMKKKGVTKIETVTGSVLEKEAKELLSIESQLRVLTGWVLNDKESRCLPSSVHRFMRQVFASLDRHE